MKIPKISASKVIVIGIVLVILGALAWHYRESLTRESIVAFARGLPLPAFLAFLFLLPLVGFPLTPLLLVTGIRFGFTGGMALATGAVFFHNFAAYRLTHGFFREPLKRKLDARGYSIPELKKEHHAWFTAIFASVHGPPYAPKLYLLALTEVPLRIYMGIGATIYALFCAIPIGAGSAVSDFNPWIIYGVIGVTIILPIAGYALKRRLARRGKLEPAE